MAYWVDNPLGDLAGQLHGQMTHLLQDLVVNEALGGPHASAEFRQTAGKGRRARSDLCMGGRPVGALSTTAAPQPNCIQWARASRDMDGTGDTGDYVCRFTYDLFYMLDPGKTHDDMKRLKKTSCLSQPESLRLLLKDLADSA